MSDISDRFIFKIAKKKILLLRIQNHNESTGFHLLIESYYFSDRFEGRRNSKNVSRPNTILYGAQLLLHLSDIL